ncbi:MAG: dihydrofolate reductase, partial [Ilumatobacteraceae bacterium]
NASMSLDGYIAKDDNTIGQLFDWLQNGDVEFPTATKGLTFHLNQKSADRWQEWVSSVGVLVCGRTLFDFTDGWDGRHSMDVPVVVVTHKMPIAWTKAHPDAPFHFVTTGVHDAIVLAQSIAGDMVVGVAAGTIAGQCLGLGLLDEVAIDLVPVVMGGGRAFFVDVPIADHMFGDPTVCIQGDRVTHLVFPVRTGSER